MKLRAQNGCDLNSHNNVKEQRLLRSATTGLSLQPHDTLISVPLHAMVVKGLRFECTLEDPTDPLIEFVVGSNAYGDAQNRSELCPEDAYKQRPAIAYARQQPYTKRPPGLDATGE